MWPIFKVFIDFVTIVLLFCFLPLRHGDQACTSCIGRRSLEHWTARETTNFKFVKTELWKWLSSTPAHGTPEK